MNCSDSQIPRSKHFLTNMTDFLVSCKIMTSHAKVRNSSIVYHKTKNTFGVKVCMNSSFQLLLDIMKVKSQEDQKICSLNFSDM